MKVYVKFFSDKGILRRNESASWFKNGYFKFLHRLTLGLGSFLQWILIPHCGYLKQMNVKTSTYISSKQAERAVEPHRQCSWTHSYQ